ncbi:hypothetical protein CVT26_012959 [Gymnopilus dilepis]|uniref:Uncharacterized protein n=1 Tax=Gymnopilus dilepis TaxID=231916 RepID=A0A409WVH4_9AGAR|nr:hypothetical protein CVT26_012959 [Gymnopilus dilepis]
MSVAETKLKAAIWAHKRALKLKIEENKILRKALHVLTPRNSGDMATVLQTMDNYNSEDMSLQADVSPGSEDEAVDMDGIELPEPIHGDDDLYYCTKCTGEIEEGFCAFCGEEHQWFVDDNKQDFITTISQATHPDRRPKPRANTPLREIDTADWNPPEEYRALGRDEEYWELIRRGATPLMCMTFDLEFSYERGIYAWADEDLFCEFSGSLMEPGDSWKISLGRCVSLDKDDLDGSEFVEGLLEEALYYSRSGAFPLEKQERWESVEESPGLWVTRLQASPEFQDSGEPEQDEDWDFEQVDFAGLEETLGYPPSTETIVQPNQYSISDDDLEMEAETDDTGFFNPEGRDMNILSKGEDMDELADDNDPDDSDEVVEIVKSEGSTVDDSDEAGKDFSSDEGSQ